MGGCCDQESIENLASWERIKKSILCKALKGQYEILIIWSEFGPFSEKGARKVFHFDGANFFEDARNYFSSGDGLRNLLV